MIPQHAFGVAGDQTFQRVDDLQYLFCVAFIESMDVAF